MSDCNIKYLPRGVNINKICCETAEPADARLYREIIGSLIYAMTGTRSDLSFAVTKLSQ